MAEAKKHKTFFSSDWHLSHKNIIKYDPRPFATIEEMDKTIIDNYNSVVGEDDEFFYLGDFCFNNKKVEEFLEQLNGKKYFIKGNHDHSDVVSAYKKYGTYLGGLEEIEVNKQLIVLCHYTMRNWNQSHRGAIHLYGHDHGALESTPHGKSMDVFVGLSGYYPLEFTDIMSKLKDRKVIQVGHHKPVV